MDDETGPAITAEQKAYFDTFGFLVLRKGFSRDEVSAIDHAYEEVMAEALASAGKSDLDRGSMDRKFVIDPRFCERRPVLKALTEGGQISNTVEHLLGQGSYYTGSDGSLRAGDTDWHPDQGWDPSIPGGRSDPQFAEARGHYYPGIKVAIYLDPVTKDSGCLSVVPGSHISPFHETLASLHCDIPERGPHLLSDPTIRKFGLSPRDVPRYPVETSPGDIVFFSHQLWHASFGGSSGRRMFAMGFKAKPTDDLQRKYATRSERRLSAERA